MQDKTSNSRLGRGIDSLLQGNDIDREKVDPSITEIPVDAIEINVHQPRKHFDSTKLRELAESIMQKGIIQPLIVEEISSGRYRIIAGERRYRAAKMAGIKTVPIILRNNKDDNLEIALIENIQREALNPIEEAAAYINILEKSNMTQIELAKKLGISRTVLTNTIRLLQLGAEIRTMIVENRISAGHARAILAVKDHALHLEFARIIQDKKLSVRTVEQLAEKINKKGSIGLESSTKNKVVHKNVEIQAIEDSLLTALGTKVQIKGKVDGGYIAIHYYSLDDLNRVILLLGIEKNISIS